MNLQLYTILFSLNLPLLITAQCDACTSYGAALDTCQSKTTSANLTMVGTTMDTAAVDCMCKTDSNQAQMNTCQGCAVSGTATTSLEDYVDQTVVSSWYFVCKVNDQWGNEQGAACWKGQPLDLLPCLSNSLKEGDGSTSGGSAGGETSLRLAS